MNPITYPARPIGSGGLPAKFEGIGEWRWEEKLNGERLLIHIDYETGQPTVWNRKGEPSAHVGDFTQALAALTNLTRDTFITWWDCEGLSRRHAIAKGSLVVLDWVPTQPDVQPTWSQRKAFLHRHLGQGANFTLMPPLLGVCHTWTEAEAREAWEKMQAINRTLGAEVYEGLIAHRCASKYPVQLVSPDQTTADLIRFRWKW